ncbi:MAG: hypothetical protein QF724_07210 [Planctomycetota bacterium]|jgi:hypothetical protein|nr:hypothetical protein [Planctomycetota bacterium]MDP6368232.1 hypothetical protein [Planctomycetota bacterium]MDP6518983.1 hypothetical protein [Planctomycetota bacterium]MDP6838707.1 hypothetical protein [Planctomycetota bacterium]MDP6956420.1 hypothetical protein [Planctomycetota bacterium]
METDQPTEESELAPFVIEGARSSRSKCKTCRRKIDKDVLRLGILLEGPYGTGYLWHHLNCAAKRRFEDVEEAFAAEAWNAAKVVPKDIPPLAELGKLREEAEQKKKERKEIPWAEVSPSGRSKCVTCGEAIAEGSVRVNLGRLVEFGNQVRTNPVKVHPSCVARQLGEADCDTDGETLAADLRANSAGLEAVLLDGALAQIDAS